MSFVLHLVSLLQLLAGSASNPPNCSIRLLVTPVVWQSTSKAEVFLSLPSAGCCGWSNKLHLEKYQTEYLCEFWKSFSPSGTVLRSKVQRNTNTQGEKKKNQLLNKSDNQKTFLTSYHVFHTNLSQQLLTYHLSELIKKTTIARRFITPHKRIRVIYNFVDSELIIFPDRDFPLEEQTPVLYLFSYWSVLLRFKSIYGLRFIQLFLKLSV